MREAEQCAWYNEMRKKVLGNANKYPDFLVRDGKLYKHFHERHSLDDDAEQSAWKLCLPKPLRQRALHECHDAATAGHLGITKTIARLAQQYYWPGMFREAANHVRKCDSCRTFKTSQRQTAGKMHHRQISSPADTLAADLIGPLPRSTNGHTHALVVQDIFTKWVEARPLRKATAAAITKALEEIIYHHGCPRRVITDNGRQFESREFKNMLETMGIKQQNTSPYSPQYNPVEREF